MNNSMPTLKQLGFSAGDVRAYGIQDDSRLVKQGDIYICLPRAAEQAHVFCQQAIAQGAIAIVSITTALQASNFSVPLLMLADMQALGIWLRRWHGTENSQVNCIGITGTDGKTSVAWMLREALQRYYADRGDSVWSVGTLGLMQGHDFQNLGNTTPSLLSNHQILADASRQNIAAVIWEVSSHGIMQERIAGIPYQAAIWTTLGHDHIEDHGSFEHYATTKAGFITHTAQQQGTVIYNADQAGIQQRLQQLSEAFRYQQGNATTCESHTLYWQLGEEHSLLLQMAGESISIQGIPLGHFHAQNMAAVALVLHQHFSIPMRALADYLNNMTTPPGRMQHIGHQVFIDFAHTPEALEGCLQQSRQMCDGALFLVFGCGGNRDRGKRPQMGAVASRYADQCWLTSDNPRFEDPEQIIADIAQGMHGDTVVHQESDREHAIATAIACMQENDMLIIAGKGHETYIEIADKRTPWLDADVAHHYLQQKFSTDARSAACN